MNYLQETNLARQSEDWNEGLAEDLQDPEFAREFLTAAVKDGVTRRSARSSARQALLLASGEWVENERRLHHQPKCA